MVEYRTCGLYISEAATDKDKIIRIEAVISVLLDTALKAAGSNDLTSYSLDDGQSKIMTVYRNTNEIIQAIKDFEALKQIYINRLNGRVFTLVDRKNLKGNGIF